MRLPLPGEYVIARIKSSRGDPIVFLWLTLRHDPIPLEGHVIVRLKFLGCNGMSTNYFSGRQIDSWYDNYVKSLAVSTDIENYPNQWVYQILSEEELPKHCAEFL